MEIKTTSEIKKINESHRMKSIHDKKECLCGDKFSSVYRIAEHIALFERRWVAVDDIKEWLLNEINRAGAPTQMFREFEKSLSTSQSEGTELKFKDKQCPICGFTKEKNSYGQFCICDRDP